jgi:predicted amidohydrolase
MAVLAAAQVAVDIDDRPATLRAVVAAVEEAARAGADLVVLPELVTTGYVFATMEEATSLAEPVSGESVTMFRELSGDHHLTLVSGFAERAKEALFNSAVLLDRGELRCCYRKTHLWDTEKLFFAQGSSLPPVVQTRLGRVAVMICYDLEFPEVARQAAVDGAQLITAPVNWPLLVPPPAGERPIEVVKAQAAAATNRVAVVVADRCGPERGVPWIGGSLICDSAGYPLAGPATGSPAVLIADVDLTASDHKSLGPRNDALADRRTDLYRRPQPASVKPWERPG